jgi:hypothetical protein
MCPKVEIVYDRDLGNIKLPSKLKDLLTDYCQQNRQRKSVVVRSALVHWLNADVSTCMDHMLLSQEEENNGAKRKE